MNRLSVQEKFFQFLLPPVALTTFLWFSSNQPIFVTGALSALALACFPWWSYQSWVRSGRAGIPVFAVVSFAYWLYFGFALFWGDYSILMWRILEVGLSLKAINLSMVLAVLGVTSLWLGGKSKLGPLLRPRLTVDVAPGPKGRNHIRLVLVGGLILSLFEGAPGAAGPLRQLVFILQLTVPLAAFLYLLREYLKGRADRTDKALIATFLVVKTLLGAASGWVGALASIFFVCGVLYMEERRRIPVVPILLLFVSFLFLQAGKTEFRSTYWGESQEGGKLERVAFWLSASWESWARDLDDPSGAAVRDRIARTFARTSLLPQTANVLELTPRVVPYQGGHLYSYMLVTLIPRFLWPEKPSVSDANRFYQVAYGLTTEENLDTVSIAVGTLTEAYISYGWWGAVGIMFLIGVALDLYQRVFLSEDSGRLMHAIGLAMVFQLMAIESQMAQYLGGLIQQIAVTIIVMLPVLRVYRLRSPAPRTRTYATAPLATQNPRIVS